MTTASMPAMAAADRPRALFLSPLLPARTGNGLAMRAGLFLEAIAHRHAVDVAVIPVFGGSGRDDGFAAAAAASCRTLPLANPQHLSPPHELLATAERRRRARELLPLPSVCRPLAADAESELRALAGGARLVHVMRGYLAPCVDILLDRLPRPALTLDLDELDSDVARQLGDAVEAERFERLERYYTPRFDHVFLAAPADAETVRGRHGALHVSAVVNTVREPVPADPCPARHDLLFVGNLSYAPNVDAARWLCEEIRPRLPGRSIAIVGSAPTDAVRMLGRLPDVTLAADVPDVGPWYAAARLAAVPLRVGGGTRTKIAEALAYGRPVVSTSLGAAGLATGESHGILIADGAAAFAERCEELLRDPARSARVAAEGRTRLTPAAAVIERLERIIREIRPPRE